MIDLEYTRAKKLLRDKRVQLDALASALLEKEVLHRADLEAIIGKRPFVDPKPGESASFPDVEHVHGGDEE
jgi:cell division protease FtsH